MPKLPVVSGSEARKAFERAGWQFKRVGSSRHIILVKNIGQKSIENSQW
jgi:predicted RNA binding protein YcfA (HicA-like mRNA interferase family)